MNGAPHARLDRALALAAEIDPAAAAAGAAALTDAFGESPADDFWHTSQLARDGFPVEVGVVPGEPGLRYTSECAGPAVIGVERLDRALAAAARLGAAAPDASVVTTLRHIQAAAPERLRYGAWLAGRHASGHSRFKLYAEVPRRSEALWQPWERLLIDGRTNADPVLPTRAVTLRMVGLDLAAASAADRGGRIELYYKLSSLYPSEVATLAARVGLAERTPDLLALLRQAACLPLTCELPCRYDWFFSYALGVGGPVFTLYTFANNLFGGDGKIRRALLALGEARGWDLSFYERLSSPLATRRGFITCHGFFGVTVTSGAAPPATATWGLTPPGEAS